MADPHSPYHWLDGPGGHPRRLGEIFCVSFFHGLAPADVLRRFGPDEEAGRRMPVEGLWEVVEDFVRRTRGGSGSGHVGVRQVGEWSVALELLGWYAVLHECYPAFSRGCEMVAVSRHEVTGVAFTPSLPDGPFLVGAISPHR